MNMLHKNSGFLFISAALFLLILSGCALKSENLRSNTQPEFNNDIKRIGIIKFNNQTPYPNAGIKAADIFHKELASYNKFELVAPDEMEEKGFGLEFVKTPKDIAGFGDIDYLMEKSNIDKREKKAIEATKMPELDAIVTGVITRYDDKDGSKIAVNKPASVAFKVYLIRVKDNKTLWSANFAETQRALFDNLLLIERFNQAGGVWLTNKALTEIGMQEVIRSFPGLTTGKVKIVAE